MSYSPPPPSYDSPVVPSYESNSESDDEKSKLVQRQRSQESNEFPEEAFRNVPIHGGTYGSIESSTHQIEQSTDSTNSFIYKTYKRRWIVLSIFMAVNFMQGYLNNIWPVIAVSAKPTFNWTDMTIALQMMWLYITYLIVMFPFAWLMDRHGLRVSMILCMLLIFCGSVCRVITGHEPYVTWLAHLGQMFTGCSGPVAFTGGAIVSTLWFPPDQRATATAIGTIAGFAGAAICFIIGPYFVDSPMKESGDAVMWSLFHMPYSNYSRHHEDFSDIINVDEMKKQIMQLRYGECGICLGLLLLVMVYFPAKPPQPPCVSASFPKQDTWKGLRTLFNKDYYTFWLAALPAGISAGVYGIWCPLLAENLKAVGIKQSEAGRMGFLASMSGCFAGVFFSRLADYFQKSMKMILMITLSFSCWSIFIFMLIADQYILFSKVGLYVTLIILGMSINASVPLYYELCIEYAYPIPESLATGMITICYNVFPIIFLAVGQIPVLDGHSWMNWCLYALLLCCFPMLKNFEERYNRLTLDHTQLDVNEPIETIVNAPIQQPIETIVNAPTHSINV